MFYSCDWWSIVNYIMCGNTEVTSSALASWWGKVMGNDNITTEHIC